MSDCKQSIKNQLQLPQTIASLGYNRKIIKQATRPNMKRNSEKMPLRSWIIKALKLHHKLRNSAAWFQLTPSRSIFICPQIVELSQTICKASSAISENIGCLTPFGTVLHHLLFTTNFCQPVKALFMDRLFLKFYYAIQLAADIELYKVC